jgi:hypothetical protein
MKELVREGEWWEKDGQHERHLREGGIPKFRFMKFFFIEDLDAGWTSSIDFFFFLDFLINLFGFFF